jgi:HlyD family secretion protein
MKRWLWVILLAALAAAAIVWGLRPQPVPVEAATVERKPLQVTIEQEGRTHLRDRFLIFAPLSGIMQRIPHKEGATLPAGALITRIAAPLPLVLDARTREQAEARVRVAEAASAAAQTRIAAQREQVNSTRAELNYWTSQLAREQKLQSTGDIPAARLDRTRTELTRAQAALAAAEKSIASLEADVTTAQAEVAAARSALLGSAASTNPSELILVPTPVAGRVIKVRRDSAGVVQAGEPLLELGDARAIEVLVEALSADAVRLSPGMRVRLDRWGGPQPLDARVRLIEPGGFTKISALGVEEQRVRVLSTITSPAPEWASLGDGYRVEASFILWEEDNVLQVPANALFRFNGGWAIFVIDNGYARRRPVTLGQRSGLAAQILTGLNPGDSVILHPDETVEDGKLVTASTKP